MRLNVVESTCMSPVNTAEELPFQVPEHVADLLSACPSFKLAGSIQDLHDLAVPVEADGWHKVSYEVPGQGSVVEASVCRAKNGIVANYPEPYMRRRDPDCMLIGDERPTDKPRYEERFGESFDPVRKETFEWLKSQRLALFAFHAGLPDKATEALAIVPENAGFFAYGLGLLQGVIPADELSDDFSPKSIIYVAPPFRHSHFEGKQVVVHNRSGDNHELFSYNLYPGPSAKRGIYGVLLSVGESELWVTIHCSTVQLVTPYENKVVIAHEGSSGGGKSEMLEHAQREYDGSLLLGTNSVTGEKRKLTLPTFCQIKPVTDDMALCHPSLEKGLGKLTLMDAENAWFVRCNHISQYGVDPHFEQLTIKPPEDLLFLNIEGQPGATALLWEHVEDEPGKPCPNPRVVVPRKIIPDVMDGAVDVDVRSLGLRTPPCTADTPTYGIVGLFHLLPPALAWLWRLVAPRGNADPAIAQTRGLASAGVGSYWSFATGRRVDHANLLLNQIIETPEVRYVLTPNQHIGAWEVGFMPQWIAREYLARFRGARFSSEKMKPSLCPLLGYNPGSIIVEGRTIGSWFFEVNKQPEVGEEAYLAGATVLREFFHRELQVFLQKDLLPTGRRIIECCLSDGSVADYKAVLDLPVFEEEY